MKPNITTAPREEIEKYQTEVDTILSVLGCQGAYVTDESEFKDFLLDPEIFVDEDEVANQAAHNAAMLDKVNALCDHCTVNTDTKIAYAAEHIFHFEGEIK